MTDSNSIVKRFADFLAERNIKKCNSAKDFTLMREAVRSYGITNLRNDLIQMGAQTSQGISLYDPKNPFSNLFTKKAFGVFRPPYLDGKSEKYVNPLKDIAIDNGDEELRLLSGRYFLSGNLPINDEYWKTDQVPLKSGGTAKPGTASMSIRHKFITPRTIEWDRFNILTFGLNGSDKNRIKELKEAYISLGEMKFCAEKYGEYDGWDSVATYVHCYPWNSVQSFHLHVIDDGNNGENLGPSFSVHEWKNLPLDDALFVIKNEIIALNPEEEFENEE